MLAAPNRL